MLGLITEPCLSVRHWREAHNRHFEPVFYRLSLSAEFCQAAPLWQLSMAQRLSTPEQNPNDWQILQTLANPVRSDSNKEAAVLHSSYTACPQPLCHFRWQALSEDGDQSYTLSTWPAPSLHPRSSRELCRRQVAYSQLLPSLGKSTELHCTWPVAQCSCTDPQHCLMSLQAGALSQHRLSNAICHCREVHTSALTPSTPLPQRSLFLIFLFFSQAKNKSNIHLYWWQK